MKLRIYRGSAKATDSCRDLNLSFNYSCGLLRLRVKSDWSQKTINMGLKMREIGFQRTYIFKIFRGSMPPDPPRKVRLRRTITFSITYEHPLENLSYAPGIDKGKSGHKRTKKIDTCVTTNDQTNRCNYSWSNLLTKQSRKTKEIKENNAN